jgi:hypothetical protein
MPTPRSAISWPLKLNLAFSSSLGTDTRSVTLPGNWNPRLASVITVALGVSNHCCAWRQQSLLRLASAITVALGVSNHCCAWRQQSLLRLASAITVALGVSNHCSGCIGLRAGTLNPKPEPAVRASNHKVLSGPTPHPYSLSQGCLLLAAENMARGCGIYARGRQVV